MKYTFRAVALTLLSIIITSTAHCTEDALEEETSSKQLFGGSGNYIHPYISMAGFYDDNIFRTNKNKIDDYGTIIAPGIWLAVPGTREKTLNLDTSTLTPGGIGLIKDRGREFKRFEGYLHYGGTFTRYQDYEISDTNDHRVDAMLQYHLKGGLSLGAINLYRDDHDDWGDGVSEFLDEYKSNLLGGRISYDFAKFRLKGDYSHYTIAYDEERNQSRDRSDDTYSAALYYRLSGKSSAFVEYDFIRINYDDQSTLDSDEHYAWGGYRRKLTGKTMGEIKLGYSVKDYNLESVDNRNNFVIQGWLDYELNSKNSFQLGLYRIPNEADNYNSEGSVNSGIDLTYTYNLTSKINISLRGKYNNYDYYGIYVYDEITTERDDDKYTASLFVDYQIQNWLSARASYRYINRDSTIEDFSYIENQVLLSLTFSI